MKRRLVSISQLLVALTVVLTVTLVGCSQGGAEVTPTAGRVKVPINATSAQNVGSLELLLGYDPAVLRATDVEKGAVAANAMMESSLGSPSQVWIGIVEPYGMNGDGAVAEVVFEVVDEEGSTALTLQKIDAYDAETLGAIEANALPGAFEVRDRSSVAPVIVFATSWPTPTQTSVLTPTAKPTLTPTPAPTSPTAQQIAFADLNLEAAVREEILKLHGPIYPADVVNLALLDAAERSISDLDALKHCTNLIGLFLWGNQITDLGALASLTTLIWVDLSENQIGDISPLQDLTSLTELYLWGNQIRDISALENLTSVTSLDLSEKQISDISPLVENSGLGEGDEVWLINNNLGLSEGSEDLENIRQLEGRGAVVQY